MPLTILVPDSLGELVYQFVFYVPPTRWEEVDKKKGRVLKESPIFSQARQRVGSHGGHGHSFPPKKNQVEQANILEAYLLRVQELDIERHFPWVRGKVGITLLGQEEPNPKSYWAGKPHTSKPDCSNMLKQFEDALNPKDKTGFIGLYLDDSWVTILGVDKQYGSPSGVWATISLFDQPLVNKPVLARKRKPDVH